MAKLILFLLILLCTKMQAQNLDAGRLNRFAQAIAYAEGFGKKGALPTRYHNPGDIKVVRGKRFPGQRGVGKGGHVIFRTDADGWAALRNQITKMAQGQSRWYSPDMTITQVARKYASDYRPWASRVANVLGVPTNTRLRDYLFIMDVAACD